MLSEKLCNVTRFVVNLVGANGLSVQRIIGRATELHQDLIGFGQDVRATLGGWKVSLNHSKRIFINVED